MTFIPGIGSKVTENSGVKSDSWLLEHQDIIQPFCVTQNRDGISYGVSSAGYDIRVADEFMLLREGDAPIDPKNVSNNLFDTFTANICIIPPNSFALAKSVEYFKIPDNIIGVCLGKSTYARCGIIVNITPLEPGWEGYLTIEISNTTRRPSRIYANEGIAQVLFLDISGNVKTTYSDRKGKYQKQQGIVLSKV